MRQLQIADEICGFTQKAKEPMRPKEAVSFVVESGAFERGGQIENLREEVRALTRVVGLLVERLPAEDVRVVLEEAGPWNWRVVP